jgi:ACS family hexuronate transporter-like MFS transporter
MSTANPPPDVGPLIAASPSLASAAADPPLTYADVARPRTKFRWVILALVFFAITINYIDRMVISILAPGLKKEYGISEEAYGYITAAFALSYALGQSVSGRWLDWIGVRIGYAVALGGWCIASMLTGFAKSPLGFGVARGLLGVTESPAYPAAIKTLAEWFPKRERALAMGVANAGANVGAVAAPLAVPWLAINYGWQWAFIVTGGVGLLWLFAWLPLYRKPAEHPRVNAAELAHINSDPPDPPGNVRWARLLGKRQTWSFAVGKFLTDPIWSFYLFFLPSFFAAKYGVDLKNIGLPLVVIYVMADVGSIAGGWLSSAMIKRGFDVNAARKLTLLLCALAVTPVVFAANAPDKWVAVLLVGVAVAAHQGFSSNLYTLVPDMFPRRAVGSVAGLGGTFGYAGTTLFMSLVGLILGRWTNGDYFPVFVIAASAYLVAFAAIHLLAPRLEAAQFPDEKSSELDAVPPASR